MPLPCQKRLNQVTEAMLDGTLTFGNAISEKSALNNEIESLISRHADTLMAPDLETENMLVKQVEFLAETTSIDVIVGALIPVAQTRCSDNIASRVALTTLLDNEYACLLLMPDFIISQLNHACRCELVKIAKLADL